MTLHFLNPQAWWLAGLLAVLIALYLWDRTRRDVDVPSLLLWQEIPVATARATRLRPDWLLLLQCLLLLALIAALADPVLDERQDGRAAGRSVFVLDGSASMQAREGRATRFEQARQTLRERLAALPADDEVMLILAGPQPSVVVAPTTDHAAALRQLAAVEPVDTRANLDAALAVARRAAARGDRATRVELYSDTPRELLAADWRDTVSVFPVGETDDNLAIEGVQVFQGRFEDPREAHAYVAVRNFARREAHGVLTLALDDAVLERRGFSLAPRSVGGFPVRNLPGPGVLRASLEVDDALAADNRAHALVRPLRPLHLRVVSDDAGLRAALTRVARAVPNLDIEFVAPAAYRDAGGADVVLFHRITPPLPADAASLYVAPARDAGPFPSRAAAQAVSVVDGDDAHPTLRGLRLDLPLPDTSARRLTAPPWATTTLAGRAEGSALPLLLTGEQNGHRHAAIALDLGGDQLLGTEHVDLLVLLLNLFDWLAPTADGTRVVPTGSVEVIDALPPLPRHIADPRGGEVDQPADAPALVDARFAGEYRVSADGTQVRVFADLSDAEESDIGRPAASPFLAPASPARADQNAPRGHGLGAGLAGIAMLLLPLEWMAARRRT
ncbi:MAG: BatA and WFA domain-containing protein [Deltaproteobacteria bacterium]|nr:BatA and WFA domain-containing protein [Deltaproteobacteria bacterium]